MTNTHTLRPGLTAIAAVLALSSTPLLAQVADPSATSTAPVAADPAPVSVTATPVAPTTEAPAPTAEDPLAATTSVETVAPAPKKAASTPRAVAKAAPVKTVQTVRTERATTPVKTAAVAAPAPAAALTPAPEPVAAAPIAPVEPVTPEAATPPVTSASSSDETLPIVGAGAGALLLAGVGFALARRRRVEDDEELALDDRVDPVLADAVTPEPTFVAPTVAEPVREPAPVIAAASPFAVPAGEHSPRVAAAYAGPSEDNPSLSLKKRIKRAHALDQMERNGHVVPQPANMASAKPRPSVSTWAQPSTGGLMFGRQPTLRPAFQN